MAKLAKLANYAASFVNSPKRHKASRTGAGNTRPALTTSHPKEARHGFAQASMAMANVRLRPMIEGLISGSSKFGQWLSEVFALKVVVGAAGGGIVASLMTPGGALYRILVGMVGFFTAVFVGPLVAQILSAVSPSTWGLTLDTTLPAAGFVCGVTGMNLTAAAIAGARQVRLRAGKYVDRKMGS